MKTPSAHVLARIEAEAGIGERRKLNGGRRKADETNPSIPVVQDLGGSDTADSSGNAVIVIPGPRPGFVWELRWYLLCGPTPDVTANGTAVFYVGRASMLTAHTLTDNPLQARDTTTQIPNVGAAGAKQIRVDSQQDIIIRVIGGTAGAAYFVTAQVEVFGSSGYATSERGQD